MKRGLEALNAWLERPRAGWVLLALAAVVYLTAYRCHELYPGTGSEAAKAGWWTWSDQQRYLQQAEALASGGIDAQTYFYPLGYSALAVPFVRWMPAHAFLVPNLVLVLGAAAMWWRIARRWLKPVETLVVGGVLVATHTWLLADSMVVPWNTLATQFALLTGIWLVLAREGNGVVWRLGLLAALAYLVRPADAVAFAPLLAWAVVRLPDWRARAIHGAGGAAIVLAAWVAVGWLNLTVFGTWRTPYERSSVETVGFLGYPVSYKFFWLFVEGLPHFGEVEPALLWRYPWLFLIVPAGAWCVQRERGAGVAVLGAVGLSGFLYLNYNDFTPAGVYRFTLIHYLAWWFPLMFAMAAAACRNGWRNGAVRAGFAVAAAAVVFCAGWRLEPVTAAAERDGDGWRLPAERPVLVEVREAPLEAVKALRLDGRELIENSHYVVPYVPSHLRVLIGKNASGKRLTFASGTASERATVRVGRYRWTWRISFDRVRKVGRWVMWHAWR